MSKLNDLLARKIKILQKQLEIKNKQIEQLEYQTKYGKLPPVGIYLKKSRIFEFEQIQANKLHVVDLEIENLQLKEKLAEK